MPLVLSRGGLIENQQLRLSCQKRTDSQSFSLPKAQVEWVRTPVLLQIDRLQELIERKRYLLRAFSLVLHTKQKLLLDRCSKEHVVGGLEQVRHAFGLARDMPGFDDLSPIADDSLRRRLKPHRE